MVMVQAFTLLMLLCLTACQRSGSPRPNGGAGAVASAASPVALGSSSAAIAAVATSSATSAGSAAPTESNVPPPPAVASTFRSDERFDLLIHGGSLIDGSGAVPVKGDLLIDDGKIVHLGKVDSAVRIKRRIDAKGMVVTPGFIDTHSHADPLGSNRHALAMGVTTLCLGQDGRSAADDHIRYYAARLRKKRLAANIVLFVGHATVRHFAKVGMKGKPTAKQLARMARVVTKELEAGAFGLTTGLEYRPGSFADLEELIAIARPVAAQGGVIMSHLRSEDDDKIGAALDELIAQGKGSGARIHVSHIKIVHGKGSKRAEALLERLAGARRDGVSVTADIYPYNASYTTISILFPDFARPPHSYRKARRKRKDDLASYLRKRIGLRGGPQATLFGTGPWKGKTLAEAAQTKGQPFEQILMQLGPGGASAAYFVMDDALQTRLLRDPQVMISTDGGAGSRHPRAYGSFAKVLSEHVRKRHTLSLHEAIHKMTGLPANTLRLDKRGLLRKGYAADVLVFDPEKIADRANYAKPNRRAAGMSWVLVNGRAAIADGKPSKGKSGRLLRKK